MPSNSSDSFETVPEKSTEQVEQELNLIRYKRALSRRSFLECIGIGTVAVAGVSALNGCLSGTSIAASVSQADVLNFALNLEYLEAEFYQIAVTGARLAPADTGTATGATTGGNQVTFTDPNLAEIAAEIAADELNHVRFLRTALGSAAVPKPAINLNALGLGFASDTSFLQLARAFEDTGVSAYAGAATLLSGDNLQAAAQILAVEAYHAGNVRLQVIQKAITSPPVDANDKPPSHAQYFPVDGNALAIKRTTSQVLSIVYANPAAGTSAGGFFPQGVNGTIKTV
jgi:Ferritin-like domain